MDKPLVEKHWVEFNYPCVIIINTMLGFRCGYVGVPLGHILHRVRYDEVKYMTSKKEILSTGWSQKLKVFMLSNKNEYGLDPSQLINVHGGLTFSDYMKDLEIDNKHYWTNHWFFGYDCGHYADKADPKLLNYVLDEYKTFVKKGIKAYKTGTIRTQKFCIDECKSLARQLNFIMNGEIRQELFVKKTYKENDNE